MTGTPYYLGSAENKLNSKGQVALPARIRSAIPDADQYRNYVVVLGEQNCLFMYTHDQFSIIKDNARRVAEQVDDSGFYRSFMAGAYPVDLDPQGRFVIPQPLMKAANISGPSILFIGVDNRIEIWEPSVYHESVGAASQYEHIRRTAARDIFGI